MASTAQILRNHKTQLTEDERVKEFLEIISPLGYDTNVESDNAVYMNPKDAEKGVRVWVDQEVYPIYSINGKEYYREVFFDFVWDDERHGIESMNSDMILDIVKEYMKKYPDTLFNYEWSDEPSPFLDKADIDIVASQLFKPNWFYSYRSHLHGKALDKSHSEWILE